MELRTRYLGLELAHPFMPGASPMVDDLDLVKRLEDAGASAIVMHSLFEEQIAREQVSTFLHTESHGESFAEALYHFPPQDRFVLGPDEYLERVGRLKSIVRCPVIASLNGTSLSGWLEYGRWIQQAGADALELNVYEIATDIAESASVREDRTVEMVRELRRFLKVPLAVKLSPFYTALPHFVRRLQEAGADGVVLFNRFYQPDIDPEALDLKRHLALSTSQELLPRLRWLAILSGRVSTSLAVSGGIHDGLDALKALMAGAHAVQMVSALLEHGPEHLRLVRQQVVAWLEEHEYGSLDELRGCLNLELCPDPSAYERANYMLMLQGWKQHA